MPWMEQSKMVIVENACAFYCSEFSFSSLDPIVPLNTRFDF